MNAAVMELMMGGGGEISDLRLVPGLELWLSTKDPADIIAGTGAGVLGWKDKSGKSNETVLACDGTAQATFTNGPVIGTGDFTVALYVTISSNSGIHGIMGEAAGTPLVQIEDGYFEVFQRGVATPGNANVQISTYTKTHCAYTRTGTAGKFYINGVAAGAQTDTGDYTVAPTIIYGAAVGTRIGQSMQRPAIWGRALSAGEVATLVAAGGDATAVSSANLAVYWDFSTVTRGAATVTDTSGNSCVLTTSTGARISGARDAWQGTSASQPTWLPWSGTNYGWLPGVAGNYFSTPTKNLTGDIDFRMRLKYASWNDGANRVFVSQLYNAGNYGFDLYKGATGTLNLRFSQDGTALITGTSSAAVGFGANTVNWIRATRASASGNVNFYTSTDGSAWTQLGTANVSTTAGAMFNSTDAIRVGQGGATSEMAGEIYYADIRNTISGTTTSQTFPLGANVAATFNPGETTDGAASWTSSTGEVWTVATSGGLPATIVGRPGLLTDGSNDYMKTPPFPLVQPEWVVMVGRQVTWSNTDYIFDGNAANSGALAQQTTTPKLDIYAGTLVAGNGDLAVGITGCVTAVFNGALSSLGVNRNAPITGDVGAANMGGLTIGSSGIATGFSNIVFNELAIFSRAPSAAERLRVQNYLIRKWNLSV